MTLPRIMVAPNGATRGKADHPALPITIAETVACAVECHAAGAGGIHAHVRDAEGRHVLDAGLYAELIAELARAVPAMAVQITTEAVGRYSAADQRALVERLRPDSGSASVPFTVSVALREITTEPDMALTRAFFHGCAEAGIAVQHILYSAEEVDRLAGLLERGVIPPEGLQVLHVLGRYTAGQVSAPADLGAPLARQAVAGLAPDWAVCAFGPAETACLVEAIRRGGKARIGFENNLLASDGSRAGSNAERVAELVRALDEAAG